jgi:hypothetical protein
MAAFFATACTTPREIIREVPVYLRDTTTVYKTDSVRTTDTIIHETNTVVREADSATLATLGIQLKDNERAILILKTELLQKIRELEAIKSDSTYHHDETPVPTTEIKEVEKELTAWQKFVFRAGGLFIALLAVAAIGAIGYAIYRIKRR